MKIAICDDDTSDLNLIHSYCNTFDPKLPVSTFRCGEDLLAAYEEDFYDLVFLDIEMGPKNGLEVGTELVNMSAKPVIIFTTQSLNYAVHGYGIAMRYLPKPISFDVFSQAMHLALSKILPKKVRILSGGNQILVSVDDILYFEVLRHQLILHRKNGDCLSTRGTLSEIIEQLPGGRFAQPHKSYYVNMEYVDRLTQQSITMTNHDIVPIGRSKKDEFHLHLREYMKGKQIHEYWD